MTAIVPLWNHRQTGSSARSAHRTTMTMSASAIKLFPAWNWSQFPGSNLEYSIERCDFRSLRDNQGFKSSGKCWTAMMTGSEHGLVGQHFLTNYRRTTSARAIISSLKESGDAHTHPPTNLLNKIGGFQRELSLIQIEIRIGSKIYTNVQTSSVWSS